SPPADGPMHANFPTTSDLTRAFLFACALATGCRSEARGQAAAEVQRTAGPDGSAPIADASGAPAFTTLAPGITFHKSERQDSAHRNTQWLVVRIDVARATFSARSPRHERLEKLQDEAGVSVAVNGGFFENDGSSSGLLL